MNYSAPGLRLPHNAKLSDILQEWLELDKEKIELFNTNPGSVTHRVCQVLSHSEEPNDISTPSRLIAAEYVNRLTLISELTEHLEAPPEPQPEGRRYIIQHQIDTQAQAAQASLIPLTPEAKRFVLTITVQTTDTLLKLELANHFINKSHEGFTVTVMDKDIIVSVPPRPELNGWENQAALYTWILGEHDSFNGFETRHLLSQAIVQYYQRTNNR